jgi:hypothetical protein
VGTGKGLMFSVYVPWEPLGLRVFEGKPARVLKMFELLNFLFVCVGQYESLNSGPHAAR